MTQTNKPQDNSSEKAYKTPSEDLRNSDLKLYEEASTAVHHWSSGIPKAINYYWDMHSDKPLDKQDIESLGWVITKDYSDEYNFQIMIDDGNDFFELTFDKINSNMIIEYWAEWPNKKYNQTDIFRGYIKNKSELKRLMQQINIKPE